MGPCCLGQYGVQAREPPQGALSQAERRAHSSPPRKRCVILCKPHHVLVLGCDGVWQHGDVTLVVLTCNIRSRVQLTSAMSDKQSGGGMAATALHTSGAPQLQAPPLRGPLHATVNMRWQGSAVCLTALRVCWKLAAGLCSNMRAPPSLHGATRYLVLLTAQPVL